MGDNAAALPYGDQALAIQEKILGPEHPDVAATLNTLGNLHAAMGDFATARQIHDRKLRIMEKHLPADHRTIVETYYNLACFSALDEDRVAALFYLELSVELGFAHPIIFTDSDLASLHGDPVFEDLLTTMRTRLDSEEGPK